MARRAPLPIMQRAKLAARVLFGRSQLDAAGGGRRWTDDRRITSVAGVQADAATVSARAASFAINNPHGARIVDCLVGNLCGTGIVPRPMHPDNTMRRRLALSFTAWTDQADAEMRGDFYAIEAALCRDMVIHGEGLAVWTADPVTAAPQLRRLHPEQLDRSKGMTLPSGGCIHQGVEFTASGRIVAYWIRPSAPGDALAGLPLTSIRFPASEAIHLFRPLFPGQARGVSWFAPILLPANELRQIFDAVMVRARVAALMAGFVKHEDDDAELPIPSQDANGESDVTLEPGAVMDLLPGQSIEFSDPPDQGNVAAFATEALRMIAVGAGITYEQLSGDYSKVTYSSARQALLEFRRFAESIQHHVLVFQLCRPTWDRLIRWQILQGIIPATAFQRDRAAFMAVKWLPPAWPWIDPLKDSQAAVLEMNNLLRSRSEIVAERGLDIEQLDEEIAADKQRADRLGSAPATTATLPPEKEPADA